MGAGKKVWQLQPPFLHFDALLEDDRDFSKEP